MSQLNYCTERQKSTNIIAVLVFLASVVFQFVRARGKVRVGQHVYTIMRYTALSIDLVKYAIK
jgi:hypothetical protein